MAVALRDIPETAQQQTLNRLAVGSLVGTLYVLVSLGILFGLLPWLWSFVADSLAAKLNSAINATLLILVIIAAAVGLVIFGLRLIGPNPPPGQRAGISAGFILLFFVAVLTQWAGGIIEKLLFSYRVSRDTGVLVGSIATAVIGLALLLGVVRLFFKPRFEKWLIRMEDLGWFTTTAYKRSQGQRVRRGTIVGVLALAACGIYTLGAHHTLDSSPDWQLGIPFTATVTVTNRGDTGLKADEVLDPYAFREANENLEKSDLVRIADPGKSEFKKGAVVSQGKFNEEVQRLTEIGQTPPTKGEPQKAAGRMDYRAVTLLPHVRFTLPILLSIFTLWIGYRLVNFPPFADFLIATEAELNKVSWTTRKRLVQDTIVVLTTMLLVTVFLFAVDVGWVWLLKRPWIGVLQTSSPEQAAAELDQLIEKTRQELKTATDEKDNDRILALNGQLEVLIKKREGASRELDW